MGSSPTSRRSLSHSGESLQVEEYLERTFLEKRASDVEGHHGSGRLQSRLDTPVTLRSKGFSPDAEKRLIELSQEAARAKSRPRPSQAPPYSSPRSSLSEDPPSPMSGQDAFVFRSSPHPVEDNKPVKRKKLKTRTTETHVTKKFKSEKKPKSKRGSSASVGGSQGSGEASSDETGEGLAFRGLALAALVALVGLFFRFRGNDNVTAFFVDPESCRPLGSSLGDELLARTVAGAPEQVKEALRRFVASSRTASISVSSEEVFRAASWLALALGVYNLHQFKKLGGGGIFSIFLEAFLVVFLLYLLYIFLVFTHFIKTEALVS